MVAQVQLQKASFSPKPTAAKRVPVARAVSCSAQEASKQMGTAVAAAALALAVGFGPVDAAYADVAGLTPCSESKAFAKLEKKEIKQLEKRLKQVIARSQRGRSDPRAVLLSHVTAQQGPKTAACQCSCVLG